MGDRPAQVVAISVSEFPEIDEWWRVQMERLSDRMKCAAMELNESLRELKAVNPAVRDILDKP